jgi:hypothetical protein
MTVKLARDVTLTDIDTGAVLLDGRRGRYWQLNSSGSAVLRRLLDGEAPGVIAASLCDGAQVSPVQAEHDVSALVKALANSRLVEVTS